VEVNCSARLGRIVTAISNVDLLLPLLFGMEVAYGHLTMRWL